MQIDWLTVVAQIANFLVLVWLLNRFLYGPITRAMTAREDRIGARLAEADAKRQDAEAEADRLRGMQAELEARRAALIRQAEDEAREKREKLEAELQETTQLRRATWAGEIAAERAEVLREMRRRGGQHVQAVTRRALAAIAGEELAPALAERFIEKLEGLDDEALQRLRETVETRSTKALVESAPALPAAVRGRITKALHEVISPDIEAEYSEDSTIVLGLRLIIAEQVVEWSSAAWFDEMEEAFDDMLETMGDKLSGEPA